MIVGLTPSPSPCTAPVACHSPGGLSGLKGGAQRPVFTVDFPALSAPRQVQRCLGATCLRAEAGADWWCNSPEDLEDMCIESKVKQVFESKMKTEAAGLFKNFESYVESLPKRKGNKGVLPLHRLPYFVREPGALFDNLSRFNHRMAVTA